MVPLFPGVARPFDSDRALCKEGARVTAMGGWFVVVSHVHPSSEEGMEFLSDAFAAGLEDSTPHGEAIWSVDVHCCEPEVDEEEGSKDEKEEEALDPPSVYMAHKVCSCSSSVLGFCLASGEATSVRCCSA